MAKHQPSYVDECNMVEVMEGLLGGKYVKDVKPVTQPEDNIIADQDETMLTPYVRDLRQPKVLKANAMQNVMLVEVTPTISTRGIKYLSGTFIFLLPLLDGELEKKLLGDDTGEVKNLAVAEDSGHGDVVSNKVLELGGARVGKVELEATRDIVKVRVFNVSFFPFALGMEKMLNNVIGK
nr:hypothetical protein Iba_chr02fCG10200 [Ipomoea batatas]